MSRRAFWNGLQRRWLIREAKVHLEGWPTMHGTYSTPKSGPSKFTVVLVHGEGGSRRHWDKVVGLLSNTMSTLTIDLPGHGASQHIPKEVAHSDVFCKKGLATSLMLFCKKTLPKSPEVIYVGHGLGADVLVHCNTRLPGVKGIVATGWPITHPGGSLWLAGEEDVSDKTLASRAAQQLADGEYSVYFDRSIVDDVLVSREALKHLSKHYKSTESPLPPVDVPTNFIATLSGEKDSMVTADRARAALSSFPQPAVIPHQTIPSWGRLIHWEQPPVVAAEVLKLASRSLERFASVRRSLKSTVAGKAS